jgi:hypothetical protein
MNFQFPLDTILKIDGVALTDHNREPLTSTYERIESRLRTQYGSLRTYYVADKKTISVSWSSVPGRSAETVDAGLGAKDIQELYLANTGPVTVTLTYYIDTVDVGGTPTPTPVTESFAALFNQFSIDVESRKQNRPLYSVSLSLEEI